MTKRTTTSEEQGALFRHRNPKTYDAFLGLGAVDEVRLNILPILMGRGPRLADSDEPLGLQLVEAVPLGEGIVQLRYGRSVAPS